MGKTVQVAYSVVCDTLEEYEEFLASMADSSVWSVTLSDSDLKKVEFNGTFG